MDNAYSFNSPACFSQQKLTLRLALFFLWRISESNR